LKSVTEYSSETIAGIHLKAPEKRALAARDRFDCMTKTPTYFTELRVRLQQPADFLWQLVARFDSFSGQFIAHAAGLARASYLPAARH
jgi:hypothetical protein